MDTSSSQDRAAKPSEGLAFLLSAAGWCIIVFVCIGFSIDGLKFARGMAPETAGMKSFIPAFILGIVKPVLFALLLIGMGNLMRLGVRILRTIESIPNRIAPAEPVADKTE